MKPSEIGTLSLRTTADLDDVLQDTTRSDWPIDRAHRLRAKEVLAARYAARQSHAFGCFCDHCREVQG